jgi:ABC-2 type transport system ATP-binding protein
MDIPYWAVETAGVTKRFAAGHGWRQLLTRGPKHEKLVLDDISIAVAPGEIFGLLGPNGAGKTTFIKILCGLILPTTGRACVAGFDVVKQEAEVRQRIGLVYGDARSFFWRITLRENLRFFAALYRMPLKGALLRIEELAEIVGLEDALDTQMHFFSAGMKQRAAIARGLITDPPILFLDEPTANVDPIAAHELRRMIAERVLDSHRTIFLTTNIMSEAEELCDRVALLRHGRIESLGGVETLRKTFQPDERYQLTVGDTSSLHILQLQSLPGVRKVQFQPRDDGLFEVTLDVARGSHAVPDAISSLVAASATVWHCSQDKLSLDEMFRMVFAEDRAAAPDGGRAPLRKIA